MLCYTAIMVIKSDEYYSIPQLSKALKVDWRTIRNKLEDKPNGNIPFLKIGDDRDFRILGKDILKEFGSATYTESASSHKHISGPPVPKKN